MHFSSQLPSEEEQSCFNPLILMGRQSLAHLDVPYARRKAQEFCMPMSCSWESQLRANFPKASARCPGKCHVLRKAPIWLSVLGRHWCLHSSGLEFEVLTCSLWCPRAGVALHPMPASQLWSHCLPCLRAGQCGHNICTLSPHHWPHTSGFNCSQHDQLLIPLIPICSSLVSRSASWTKKVTFTVQSNSRKTCFFS